LGSRNGERAKMSVLDLLKKQFTIPKFTFHFLFWGSHVGLLAFGWYKQYSDPRLAGLNTLTFSVWISRGAGLALTVDGTLILLAVCRTIMRWIRPKARWLPLDENLWFHRQVAYAMLIFSIIHTAGHYVK
jgi:NADPH oxidase